MSAGRFIGALLGLLVWATPAPARTEIAPLLAAAHAQIGVTRFYDGRYERIAFPGGDVPLERGVCTDVVIRAMRAVGVDLQVEVHRDMRTNFTAYPQTWGLTRPDPNIDHRRVPNLETFLRRHAGSFAPVDDPDAYLPGDFVSWRLERGEPHIGIVSDLRSADGRRPLIVHNIGAGTRAEDVLFQWRMIGHFRYFSAPAATPQ